MRSKWRIVTIGDLVTLQRGFDLPSQDRRTGSIPVMGSAGISGYHDKPSTKGPGVVIGRSGVGSMGVTSFIDRDFWALNTTLFVTDFKGNDIGFIYYLLKSIDFRHLDSGSAQASLNRNVVYPIKVAVPASEAEQRAISHLLFGIDQRIALLRRTNETLESIARTLFKGWFVDFEPVRAKAQGREPASVDAATALLFPDRFSDSSPGSLPIGWRLGRLGDVCTNPRGQAKPGVMPEDTPYIGLDHMPRRSIALDTAGTADGLASGKFWFERNDVLFGKLRPYFHKVGLAPFRGVCSTDILVLRPTEPKWLGFVAMHASSDELISYTTQLSNGARMPRTSWHDVAAFKVAIPSDDIANAFNDLVSPLFQRIYANIATTKLLAELRDTLLPRLISGKLRLPECEEELREMIA